MNAAAVYRQTWMPTGGSILRRFAQATGVKVSDLTGPSREARIAHIRMAAIYWIRRRTKMSFPRIGKLVSRHHASVFNAFHSWPQLRFERRRFAYCKKDRPPMATDLEQKVAELTKPRPRSAFQRQEGGTHYVDMAMQPFEFAMVNRWDAGAFSILKYVSRFRAKNGRVDLQKARHFVDLREDTIAHAMTGTAKIAMHDYIDANGIAGLDAEALMALEGWVEHRLPGTTVARLIDDLIRQYDLP